MAQITHTQYIKIGDNNANCSNTIGSYNKTVYKSDEDARIMRWLSPLEPEERHHGVRSDRFDGVGGWLLGTREFREWRCGEGGADKAVLFCSRNPGVGKTYLSSLVIDTLCDEAREENIAVACLYCDYLAQQEQTTASMVEAISKQLVGRGDIPKDIRQAFQEGKREVGGRRLLLADLMRMLKITMASLPQVFICIDALDECLPKNLPELLESLDEIVRESPTTRIFFTGRPHVTGAIQRYFLGAVVIPISPNRNDIRNYLQMRLAKDDEPEAMNDELRADIVKVILDKMSDIFLLISLNIEAILGEVTIGQRRKKLEGMARGHGLSDAYTATLTRLKAQKGNKSVLGLKVLMWVLYSERPLRAKELCHALGVEMGTTDLDSNNIPTLRTLLSSCLGLVTFEASSSIVRLVHFTLQEHLLSNPTISHSPHSSIAEVCLTYLNFECVRGLSPTLTSAPSTMPFLEYASYYWGKHMKAGTAENAKVLALRLLDRFDEHISAQLLLLGYNQNRSWEQLLGTRGPLGFTGLHGASFFGIIEIVAAVLEMKEWDVNATDLMGSTALTWAAKNGWEGAVKLFLERDDVNPNQIDTFDGLTPLLWAAERGHEGVVKILLEREDVNPNQADTYGQTPLVWAARCGNEGVVEMILQRGGVNPDQADTKYGQTPLAWAAKNGHGRIVEILLKQQDVHTTTLDNENQTPLLLALSNGHNEVIRILRDNVNSNAAGSGGQAPLPLSSRDGVGRAAVVQSQGHDTYISATDLKNPPLPPPADPDKGKGVIEIEDPVSKSEDSDPSLQK